MTTRRQDVADLEHSRGVRVCAWCGKFLGTCEAAGGVSHGICVLCAMRLAREQRDAIMARGGAPGSEEEHA